MAIQGHSRSSISARTRTPVPVCDFLLVSHSKVLGENNDLKIE